MICHLLLVVALATGSAPALFEDLATRLDEVLFRLEGADGAQTWVLARELERTAQEDTVVSVRHLADAAEVLPERLQVIVAETLVALEAPDEAAGLLLPLVGGPFSELALAVLADRAFRDVDAVGEHLTGMLEQPLDPGVRIDVARALTKVSRGTAKYQGRRVLLDALESDDPETRAQAALALAETNDLQAALPELQVLASDPGPRGRLARAYLEIHDKNEYYLDRLTRATAPARDVGAAETPVDGGRGSLDVLDELMQKIIDYHLIGAELDDDEGREKLISAAARGMLSALDEHSTYFTTEEYERWILDLRRNYAGIDAYVDTIDGFFTITRPIYSGPAYQAGLMTGDRILKVDGWDTHGHDNDAIIKRLKGEPGTEVEVAIYRDGWMEPKEYVITRQAIHIPSVSFDLLPARIGLVEVVSFAESTTEELMDALAKLDKQGMQGLILDLRNNTGGYLEEAVRMSSVFLGAGKLVVSTQGRGVRQREYKTGEAPLTFDGPLVVLVNRRSASASEIVAGALQDHERARIVGERTFGKGSVQQALPLQTRKGDRLVTDANYNGVYDPGDKYDDLDGDGEFTYESHVKITNARYYLPSGRSIHTERNLDGMIVKEGGIEPDELVRFKGSLEGWENYELAALFERLRDAYEADETPRDHTEKFHDPFEAYVDALFEQDPELVRRLALGDGRDTSRYPGFAEFRASLDTPLPDETIRLWLRNRWVRAKVADDRGRIFPGQFTFGDWQEDTQLQRAIQELAPGMALDLASVESYAPFAHADLAEPREVDAEPR